MCKQKQEPLSYMSVLQKNCYLTNKQLDMYECIFSTLATDALVLKHQAISNYSTD